MSNYAANDAIPDNARILRFHTSDKVFHSVNAICWYALFITGAIVYFGNMMGAIEDSTANLLMVWHIWLGALFTLNFLGYLVFAPERFAVTMKNLMEWDKDTIMWFRNFGGYPRRFFKIPFGPEEVPPQGRYNGGQKMSYLIFIFAIAYLIVTGWLLWAGATMLGKELFYVLFITHVWGSIIVTLMVTCAHIPLALLSMEHFKGIWRISSGDIAAEAAKHHSPKWLARDVIKVNEK